MMLAAPKYASVIFVVAVSSLGKKFPWSECFPSRSHSSLVDPGSEELVDLRGDNVMGEEDAYTGQRETVVLWLVLSDTLAL